MIILKQKYESKNKKNKSGKTLLKNLIKFVYKLKFWNNYICQN